eukprot:TRINITY_DN48124_c0_g1_i1.p1 TRINITY_DN48124_c0_g1~~TRINITY_DN48124_c0_g1_i1.p1  ORF type:complete len:130 (+),score=23.66 TRINITY_DN48124_c0_g1_i1:45-434(+)
MSSDECRILVAGNYRVVRVGDNFQTRSRDGIRYCQDSIKAEFGNGGRVKSQLGHWMRDYKIEAVIHEGGLYTLNNRTWFAAKHFDRVGSPTWVDVTVVEKPSDWESRFTTTNDGSSIEVRGGGGECSVM